MSDERTNAENRAQVTPPARFSRDTLLGCLGLGCVLLTLPLLWLAVGVGSGWLSHALPLLAFAAAVGGGALTLRVPAALGMRSADPLRPLTHSGAAPAIERPATAANRAAWALSALLLFAAISGYALEVVRPGSIWGLALMLAAGALMLAQGLLVGWGRLPAPALRWLRLSIYGATGRQSGSLVAIGFVIVGAALFLALLDGYAWGLAGLTLCVLALVLLTPLARRMPNQRRAPHVPDETA